MQQRVSPREQGQPSDRAPSGDAPTLDDIIALLGGPRTIAAARMVEAWRCAGASGGWTARDRALLLAPIAAEVERLRRIADVCARPSRRAGLEHAAERLDAARVALAHADAVQCLGNHASPLEQPQRLADASADLGGSDPRREVARATHSAASCRDGGRR